MDEKDTRELAYADWKKGMKPKQLSEKYEVSINTIKSWSTRHWKNKAGAPGNKKKVRPIKAEGAPNKALATASALVDKQIAEAVEENDELTQQQKDFCIYFMRNRNATQAYLKSHNCSYSTANTEGPASLVNPRIKAELKRLREIKNAALGGFCGEDVVELHMRIAFADMTDFAEFKGKSAPVVFKGEPVVIEHPKTGKMIPLTQIVNELKFKDSSMVDGQLICEVSVGREGAKVKLVDKQKSMQFLERYFELNPSDRHKHEYDRLRDNFDGNAASVNISIGDDEL